MNMELSRRGILGTFLAAVAGQLLPAKEFDAREPVKWLKDMSLEPVEPVMLSMEAIGRELIAVIRPRLCVPVRRLRSENGFALHLGLNHQEGIDCILNPWDFSAGLPALRERLFKPIGQALADCMNQKGVPIVVADLPVWLPAGIPAGIAVARIGVPDFSLRVTRAFCIWGEDVDGSVPLAADDVLRVDVLYGN
jgi:hypothetical protein